MRQRWRFNSQGLHEVLQCILRSIHPNIYTGRGVAHPTLEVEAVRKLVDKGTESHSLDNSANSYLQTRTFDHGYPIIDFNQVCQACRPSPVWQETGKVSTPRLSVSTPCLK